MSESKASVAREDAPGKAVARKKVAPHRARSRVALAIFARAPQRGQVKTRLARSLGDEAALQLYTAMLRDTLSLARRAMGKSRGETVLFFTPPNAFEFGCAQCEYSHETSSERTAFHTRVALARVALARSQIVREYSRASRGDQKVSPQSLQSAGGGRCDNRAREYSLGALWSGAALSQSEGDLGKKMRDCCETLRARGAKRVVLIGCDIPDLPPEIVAAAFAALEHCDVVFGPAHDGGFYLIGASRRFSRALFSGVRWSRADVLTRVLANARREKLRVFLLPQWRDIDDISDLRALQKRLRARG